MRSLKQMAIAAFMVVSMGVIAQTPPSQNSSEEPAASPAPQSTYQPKFPGDPARSESESKALGYMRVVLRAQKEYKKKNNKFATSLSDLVHTGSFTRRMTSPDRGDYTAGFRSKKDGFELTMTPKEMSPERRSFYADDDGKIHADDEKPADEHSPVVK
jgi:hypothetical protein